MRLSVREDLDLPIEIAFREIADVARLERQLLRRGIDVMRTDMLPAPGPGMGWSAGILISGARREAQAVLKAWEPPQRVAVEAQSARLGGDLVAEFSALSRHTTRLRVLVTVRASGFRDRMLLKSLEMSKRRLERRFGELLGEFARAAEARAARI